MSCWTTLQEETIAMGSRNSDYAGSIISEACQPLHNFLKNKEIYRKQLVIDGEKYIKELHGAISNAVRCKNNFDKATKEAEISQVQYDKSLKEGGIKPKDIAKLSLKASQQKEKGQLSDEEYKTSIKTANEIQDNFYNSQMPKILDELQQIEVERIEVIKQSINKLIEVNRNMPQNFQTFAKALENEVNSIDGVADINDFIEENKSGNIEKPSPMEYEPYGTNSFTDENAPSKKAGLFSRVKQGVSNLGLKKPQSTGKDTDEEDDAKAEPSESTNSINATDSTSEKSSEPNGKLDPKPSTEKSVESKIEVKLDGKSERKDSKTDGATVADRRSKDIKPVDPGSPRDTDLKKNRKSLPGMTSIIMPTNLINSLKERQQKKEKDDEEEKPSTPTSQPAIPSRPTRPKKSGESSDSGEVTPEANDQDKPKIPTRPPKPTTDTPPSE